MIKIILIILIIPAFYAGIHFGLQRMAIDQYTLHVMGIRKSDKLSWQEIYYMKLQHFEISILHKLGIIK